MKVLLPGKHVAKLPTHLELDLLNLSGLSVGWVLSADGDSSASWKQLSHTLLDDIGNNNHNAIDSHIADGSKHFLEGAIDHTAILNIGSNNHTAIDTHLAGHSATVLWSEVEKTVSSLADLATKSAGALDSGNLAVARMPLGGDWNLTSNLNINNNDIVIQAGQKLYFDG